MTLLFMLACRPLVTTADPSDQDCAAGEVRLLVSGESYSDLGGALARAAEHDQLCVGAGRWDLGSNLGCDAGLDWADLTITGSGDVVLVGAGDAGCYSLAGGEGSTLSLSNLTLENAPIYLEGDPVTMRDVEVTGYTGSSRALRVRGEFAIEGLLFQENRVDYGAGFDLSGNGSIEDFDVVGNSFEEGYVGEIAGAATWIGGQVADNERLAEKPGYDFLETWGELSIDSVTFARNAVNGPVLTSYETLSLTDVTVEDNDANFRGALATFGALSLVGGAVTGNIGADGAIALYDGGTLSAEAVSFEANGACTVSGDGLCLAEAPAGTLTCDVAGCE